MLGKLVRKDADTQTWCVRALHQGSIRRLELTISNKDFSDVTIFGGCLQIGQHNQWCEQKVIPTGIAQQIEHYIDEHYQVWDLSSCLADEETT